MNHSVIGSVRIEEDDLRTMVASLTQLIEDLMRANRLTSDDLTSIVFSATDDLPGLYADQVVSNLSITHIPFYSLQEFRYLSEMDRCAQVILYLNRMPEEPKHLMLGCEDWAKEWEK